MIHSMVTGSTLLQTDSKILWKQRLGKDIFNYEKALGFCHDILTQCCLSGKCVEEMDMDPTHKFTASNSGEWSPFDLCHSPQSSLNT